MRKSKYNRSDKSSTTQGTALGTKAPGTAPISFLSTQSKRERQRDRESEREMLRLCPVCDTCTLEGLAGIMTVNLSVLMSAPMEKMDYTSSCLFE